jgi:hypothetical protein
VDYSRWFRDVIKNRELADAAETIETDESLAAQESRSASAKPRSTPATPEQGCH